MRSGTGLGDSCVRSTPLNLLRNRNAWIFLLIGLVGTFQLATIQQGHSWGDDFAQYLMHARNIAEGRAYADTGFIRNPYSVHVGPKAYPPLTPLLLAPVYRACGLSFSAFKTVMVAALVLSLFALCLVFRKRLTWPALAALVALTGFNPVLSEMKDHIGSDLPFLFLCFVALYAIDKISRPVPAGHSVVVAMATALLIYLAYADRSAGLVLVPVLVLAGIVKSSKLTRPVTGAAGMALVLILVQNCLLGVDADYVHEVLPGFTWKVPLISAWGYAKEFSGFFANGYSPFFGKSLYVLTAVLAALGFFRQVRRGIGIIEVFTVAYFGLISVFPGNQGTRYLIPLFPIFLYYALTWLEPLASGVNRSVRGVRLLAFAVVGLMAFSYATWHMWRAETKLEPEVTESYFVDVCSYLRSHTRPDDVLIFRKPRVLALLTGRKAAVYNNAQQFGRMEEFLDRVGAAYIVVADLSHPDFASDGKRMLPFIESHPSSFRMVYRNGKFSVYRVGAADAVPRSHRSD